MVSDEYEEYKSEMAHAKRSGIPVIQGEVLGFIEL